MKKIKIKQLALLFVMALVVGIFSSSMILAANPAMNSTKKVIYMGRENKDNFQFKVNNQVKGWKYAWKSSNTKIATVNSSGKTIAKGVGRTTISVKITDSKGKAVKTLKSTIVVRDLMVDVKIDNPINTLKVNEGYAYKRSYITESGSQKRSSSISRWTIEQNGKVVTDKNIATIDNKGLFVAKEAGTYDIYVRTFQSKAKYDQWLSDNTRYKNNVNAVYKTTVEVTPVKPLLVSQTIETKSSIKMIYNLDMRSSGIDKSTLHKVYGTTEYAVSDGIKSVEFDSTGKIVTINFKNDFETGFRYRLKYSGQVEEFEYVKASKSAIKSIRFTQNPIKVYVDGGEGVNLSKLVNAYDERGNMIYTGEELGSYLRFETNDYSKASILGNTLYMYDDNASATIKAVYEETIYDYNTYYTTEVIKLETQALAVGTKTDTSIIPGSMGYILSPEPITPNPNVDSGWTTNFRVAKGEHFYLYARYKTANKDGYQLATYRFESADLNKVIINSGNFAGFYSTGTVDILVKDMNNNIVDVIKVTVLDSRRLDTAIPVGGLNATLSNSNNITDEARVKFTLTDNLGDPYNFAAPSIVLKESPKTGIGGDAYLRTSSTVEKGQVELIATAKNARPGMYVYEVEFYRGSLPAIKHLVRVNVIDGNTNKEVVNWIMELPNLIDLKNEPNAKVTANVYGINSLGVKVEQLVLSDTINGYALKVYKNSVLQTGTSIVGNVINIAELGTGNYTIQAVVPVSGHTSKRQVGALLGGGNINVIDTNIKKVEVKNDRVNAGVTREVINNAFTFILNGKVVDLNTATQFSANILGGVTDPQYLQAQQYHVYTVTINNITYEVGKTITVY